MKKITALVFLSFLFLCSCSSIETGTGPTSGQIIYPEAQDALKDLKLAFQSADLDKLDQIYGSMARDLIHTGDPAADIVLMKRIGRRFAERAELFPLVSTGGYPNEQWYGIRYAREGWNMRVPLINRGQGWFFAVEYLNTNEKQIRRSLNEYSTVGTLLALIKAQKSYYSRFGEYAQKYISSPGEKDGLYWPTTETESPSPLDDLVAQAVKEGYLGGKKDPVYQGYVYKVLHKRGKGSKSGAINFEVNGKLTRGVAILAHPLKWGVTGNNTFVTGLDGKIYKKNLGNRSDKIAPDITEMENDRTWWLLDRSSLGVQKLLVD